MTGRTLIMIPMRDCLSELNLAKSSPWEGCLSTYRDDWNEASTSTTSLLLLLDSVATIVASEAAVVTGIRTAVLSWLALRRRVALLRHSL